MRKILLLALLIGTTAQAALHDIVTKGAVNRSVTVSIIDSADGTPETGVVFNTAGIDLWYRREGALSVDVTEATLAALTTAHTDGGFLHVNDGVYRLDLPDAAFATGANYVDFGGTVTGMIVIGGRVRLADFTLESAGVNATTIEGADATDTINAQVDQSIIDNHLDHLFATSYDPAAKPGVADALLNELVESDAGASRFTTNALEQAPSGGGALTQADLGIEEYTILALNGGLQTDLQLSGGSPDNDKYNEYIALLVDQADPSQGSLVEVLDWVATGENLTLEDTPGFTIATGDTVILFPAFADSAVTLAAADIRTAVGLANPDLDTQLDAFGTILDLGSEPTLAGNLADIEALVDDIGPAGAGLTAVASQASVDAVPTAAENATTMLSEQRILTGICDSGSTTTCVDAALTQAAESQLDDRLICFDDEWCALITGFTPGTDTVTTTKVAPSTRAALEYTIFPATAQ